jgi:hypothetical protein
MALNVMMDTPVRPTVPAWVRLLGGRRKDGRGSYRMAWGELSKRNGAALELALFSEHFSLIIGAWLVAYIDLPFLNRWHREPFEIMESWGFSYRDSNLRFNWGRHTKGFQMPWSDWRQIAHDVQRQDGSWAPYVGSWEQDKEPDGRFLETHPYRYLLSTGTVQERVATIYVERRTRKLRWLPFGVTTHAIEVEFSDEVGDKSGSWKGGCIGCSYEIREDETPRACLRRMERERRFK